MKKLATIVILLMPLGVAAQSAAEQAILKLSSAKFNWLSTKQYDSLDRLLDDRMEFVHSNGWVQTKKDVIEDLKSGKLHYQKVTIKEAHARMYGDVAVVQGLGTFEGLNSGNAFSIELRYSEVYIKQGGRWKFILRHANRMP